MKKYYNPKTKELFKTIVENEYQRIKKKDELIFNEIDYNINSEKLFESFLDDPFGYKVYLNLEENEKKNFIRRYLVETTLIPAFEKINKSILEKKIKSLEEGTSFFIGYSTEGKIESTAKFLIENYVFDIFPRDIQKKLTNIILEERRLELNKLEDRILEESINDSKETAISRTFNALAKGINFTLQNIVGAAKTLKYSFIFLLLVLYSPWTLFASETMKYNHFGMSGNKTIKKALELIWPLRSLMEMIFSPYSDLGKILKDTNEFNNPDIRKLLQDISGNSRINSNIINSCWTKNIKETFNNKHGDDTPNISKPFHWIADNIKRAIQTTVGDPQDLEKGMLGWLFTIDATDPVFQRQFFEFRKCVYDHIFDVILGYAKIGIEMDLHNTKIIELIKQASRRKDYIAFQRLTQNANEREIIMYKVGKALLAIDEIAESLKDNKRDLYQDKYIDKFYLYLKQRIKQLFLDLDEIAEKKTGEAKDKRDGDLEKEEDENYTEDWKSHSLKTIRDGKKPQKIKSIYEM